MLVPSVIADMKGKPDDEVEKTVKLYIELRSTFEKAIQEIENIRQSYNNISRENYKSKMLFT